jgi:arginyl-tRNA synthetase
VYRDLQRRLASAVQDLLRRRYDIDLPSIAIEQPPKVEFGEYALPLAFELAKRLRKPPRKIAEEIVAEIGPIPGFERFELAGAGYINARVNRGELARNLFRGSDAGPQPQAGKVLVEHTSINPNKAAHIGHLRNAVLGDTFVRLLRSAGREVDVQNYIDNTGVQVADIVVGLTQLEHKDLAAIRQLTRAISPPFDFYCWDLYARVSQWYEQDKRHLEARAQMLHAIEEGGNEQAAIAELVSSAILRRHLETMERLGIEYDFLPRESEILHLHFWDAAFTQLKQKGVLTLQTSGKNAGCWVMQRPGAGPRDSEDQSGDDQKVIVRSNGTVGYVGKDIAYHLWKFGLLGRDFGYARFFRYPTGHQCWVSTDPEHGEAEHPHFGGVSQIYNVIDARQAEAQNTVIEALRALGYTEQAEHYTHFSYEMVALTPRCAEELGYVLSEDDRGKSYIEVSGRRGFGVKADDLIDKLIASARKEVDTRHPDLPTAELAEIAGQIAVGALRYFMLKFTKNSVIAFDFRDALSFEGDTGPYAQYAVVRATNIFRKAGVAPDDTATVEPHFDRYLAGDENNELWELWLTASKTSLVIDQSISTTEPAYVARYAFQLAQLFNNFYHRHRVISEPDEHKRAFLLATASVVRRELIRVLSVMGISAPAVM